MKQTDVRRFHSQIAARGLRVPTWAKQHGFNPKTVYSALRGRFTGQRKGKVVARVLATVAKEIAA